MSLGLVVEGELDLSVVRTLLRRLGRSAKYRVSHGNGRLLSKLGAYVRTLEYDGATRVVVLKDADGDKKRRLEGLKRAIRSTGVQAAVTPVVVVQEIESWLLADRNAVKSCLGLNSPPRRYPEDFPQPKEEVQRLFRKARKVYSTKTAEELASRIDLEAVKRERSSFKEFITALSLD